MQDQLAQQTDLLIVLYLRDQIVQLTISPCRFTCHDIAYFKLFSRHRRVHIWPHNSPARRTQEKMIGTFLRNPQWTQLIDGRGADAQLDRAWGNTLNETYIYWSRPYEVK